MCKTKDERPKFLVKTMFSIGADGKMRVKTLVYNVNYPIENVEKKLEPDSERWARLRGLGSAFADPVLFLHKYIFIFVLYIVFENIHFYLIIL